jgi:uncharacterized surface protein with fasciclin (FAS1) repeats
MKSHLYTLFILILSFLSLVGCRKDVVEGTDVPEALSILDVAQKNDDLELFVKASKKLNIARLERNESVSVFAPTDAAIQGFLDKKGYASIDAVPLQELNDLILNHMVLGDFSPSTLPVGYINSLAETKVGNSTLPLSLFIERRDRDVYVNGSLISKNAEWGDKGVLYTTDKLLDLPDARTHILSNPTFASFAQLLERKDLDQNYMELFRRTPNATLFIPSNGAFASFLIEQRVASLDKVPVETISTILRYHLSGQTNVAFKDLINGQALTTIQGKAVSIEKNGTSFAVLDVKGRRCAITQTDIRGTNGVIHVTNRIALPN